MPEQLDEECDMPIDAVITWVDGNDASLRSKRTQTLETLGDYVSDEHIMLQDNRDSKKIRKAQSDQNIATALSETRFADSNEIYFCIRSIRKFAPWFRRIYLVTDQQKPHFLTPSFCEAYQVYLIDHKEIFRGYEWALPTFNTRTIETALWRIPDIAPRFVSFNDDFLIISPVTHQDFFTKDGVILRGKYNRQQKYGPFHMAVSNFINEKAQAWFGITRTMHLLQQMLSARLAGFTKRYFRVPHVPQPVITQTLADFFETHPESFQENIRYRLRNTRQFSAIFLAHHLHISQQRAQITEDFSLLEFNGELDTRMGMRKKLKKLSANSHKFACFNSLEKYLQKDQDTIIDTLQRLVAS